MKKIAKNLILDNKIRPKIIAEISGNHAGNKKRFLNLIKSAFINGADLVKIQTYEPIDITLNKKNKYFKISSGIWKNTYLWSLYKKACTPFSWHKEAFKIAKTYKKIIFSSPFSIRAVNHLESFDCPIYKIASFEITDLKLINYVASKRKKIILSTGMSNILEIKKAIKIINKYHNNIVILHCISSYPTKIKDADLNKILYLKKLFPKYEIGLSDHTNGISTSIIATHIGVSYIEKHFNLDNMKTADSTFSIKPYQLKELSESIDYLFDSFKKRNPLQKKNIFLRRSIFSCKNIKKNEKITIDNINTLRPKIGICASEFYKILNRKAKRNIKKNEPIHYSDLK